MATSDRLYELSCECRDNEEALDRLRRDLSLLEARWRGAQELLEALDDMEAQAFILTPRVAEAARGLRQLK